MVIVEILIKSAVVVASALVAARTLASMPAATRHAVLTTAVIIVLLLPLLALLDPPRTLFTVSHFGQHLPFAFSASSVAEQALTSTRSVEASDPQWVARLMMAASVIWMTGTLLLLTRCVYGLLQLRRLAQSAPVVLDLVLLTEAQRIAGVLGIKRPIQLRWCMDNQGPATWGCIYPILFIPVSANQWSERQRHALLVHELAHIRRCDALSLLCARLAVALYWINPLVWLALDRVKAEHEQACDDWVLRFGVRPSEFVGHLLAAMRGGHEREGLPSASLSIVGSNRLSHRVAALVDPTRGARLQRKPRLAVVSLSFGLILLPILAFTVQSDRVAAGAIAYDVIMPSLVPEHTEPGVETAGGGGPAQGTLRPAGSSPNSVDPALKPALMPASRMNSQALPAVQ